MVWSFTHITFVWLPKSLFVTTNLCFVPISFAYSGADRENLTGAPQSAPYYPNRTDLLYRYRTRPVWRRVSVEASGHSEPLDLILIDLQIVQLLRNHRRFEPGNEVLCFVLQWLHMQSIQNKKLS